MRLLGLKTFRHGVHPPESKDETSGLAIRQFPFAPVLIVPLVQHMGKPSVATVRELMATFGPEKVLFGSDWPYGNRPPAVAIVKAACRGDRGLERRIFFENAAELLHMG